MSGVQRVGGLLRAGGAGVNEETAKKLRVPFPREDVGLLPRVTCRQCRDGQCQRHQKTRCAECGNWITSAHIHLQYVGHAELTDRLLEVDSEWNWEPLSLNADGAPFFDGNGGMWIKLTIGGVTRLGYGDAPGKRGGDAVKEAIGDALRNAAMRFGVALDLWRKEPAHLDEQPPSGEESQEPSPADKVRDEIREYCENNKHDLAKVAEDFQVRIGKHIKAADEGELKDYLAMLQAGLLEGDANGQG